MPIVHLPPGNPGAKRRGLSAASLVLSRRCESRSAPAPWAVSTSAAANRPAGKRFGRVHISTRAQVYNIWTKYAFLNICQTLLETLMNCKKCNLRKHVLVEAKKSDAFSQLFSALLLVSSAQMWSILICNDADSILANIECRKMEANGGPTLLWRAANIYGVAFTVAWTHKKVQCRAKLKNSSQKTHF